MDPRQARVGRRQASLGSGTLADRLVVDSRAERQADRQVAACQAAGTRADRLVAGSQAGRRADHQVVHQAAACRADLQVVLRAVAQILALADHLAGRQVAACRAVARSLVLPRVVLLV